MPKQFKLIIILSSSIILFSLIAFLTNTFIFRYIGNNYFPPNSLNAAIILFLSYLGFSLNYGKSSLPASIVKDAIVFYFVTAIIAMATNAAQLTPFTAIDAHIISFETFLNYNLVDVIAFTHKQPILKACLTCAYASLPWQMAILPLSMIVARQKNRINEYYILLLTTTLIGFVFYYFFPTTAPASALSSQYFSSSQLATGVKFLQIHEHLKPSTLDGGLIGLPSFHVIWAWLCLYLIRSWRIAFFLLMPINGLIVLACILLGWHFPTDLLGSLVVLLLAHRLLIMQRSSPKWGETGSANHSTIQQISIQNHTVV